MRRLCLIVLCLLATASAVGAAGPLPSHSPHGILIDRVLPISHLEDLDGNPGSGSCDITRLRQILHELEHSAEPSVAPLSPGLPRLGTHGSHVDLAVLWAIYDRMSPVGEIVSDRVFACAPLVPDVYHGEQVRLRLSPSAVMTHRGPAIVSWQLDADDGRGWRPLVPGRELSVAYTTTGQKKLRLQALLADGGKLWASSALNVLRLNTPPPDDTWFITATESYAGQVGTGLAHLYLAEGHTQLEQPIVVVEGFDLDNSMDWPVLYALLNQENLLEDLRARGFDAVVLDFTEATAPIQRNGFVLTQLLQQVRAAVGPDTPLQLVGASMGGLVSRYALTWLEFQGQEHGVQTFISFDSPQNGANIPLGLQHWLDFFKDEAAEADYLLSRLNTPASRQMLLYHYDQPQGGSPGFDPQFAQLRNDLAALGNWPAQPRLVAVANGSGQNQDQGFAAGAQIIRYEYRSFLADIDGNVWAVPEGGPQVIFDGMINLVWPLPDTYQTVTIGGTLPWDNAPGGFRPSMAQMDTTAVPYGDIQALYPAHCFIPTISALALDVTDPFFEIAGVPDLPALSPFDALYYPAENQEHIAITPENKTWLMEEVGAALTPADQDVPLAGLSPVLYPAFPNPFNPATTLRFEVLTAGKVDLEIFDLQGRRVRTLLGGSWTPPGRHQVTWSGRDDQGRALGAGVYLCRLATGSTISTRRLVLVK